MAAVVLAASEFAGFGVDGDALAVGPVAVLDAERVAHACAGRRAFPAEAGLEVELVGQVLVVEARRVDGLLDVEAAFGGGEKDIGDGGDDARAAGRAEDVAQLAVFQHDGRGHGAERALAGGDGVGRALDEAEHVGRAHFGGEVVHLVVEQEAERAGGDVGAEAVVERGGDGDGVAFGVDDGVVGGVGATQRGGGRRWWAREAESRRGARAWRWGWLASGSMLRARPRRIFWR